MGKIVPSHWENLRERVAGQGSVFTATIELTYRCNFECVHCYCVVGGARRELTTQEHFGLLEDLRAAGCMAVSFTGGEALLRPDFFEIAEYARKLRFVVRVFTNGLLVDEERAERIAALDPLTVDLSLYGASEETYERVTGHRGHARVVAAIERLQRRKLKLVVKIPLMQENFADLDALLAYCHQHKLPHNVDPWMTPKDDGTMGPTGSQISDEQLRDYFRRFGRKVKPVARDLDKPLCTIGRGSTIIGPYGDVFACIQSKIPAGNVREKNIAEIWKHSALLGQERSLTFRDFAECNSCEFRESCFICPSISFYENGRFNGPSKYACKVAQIRYELGQFESRPVIHQIQVPGKPLPAAISRQAGPFPEAAA